MAVMIIGVYKMIDVSVIIPTFNRKNDLIIAIDSVLNQGGVSVECIVIDDDSSDGTIEELNARFSHKNLVLIRKKTRSGAQASRNLGIEIAKGEFVTFLDSDDYLNPNTLARRVEICRSYKFNSLFSGYVVNIRCSKWSLIKRVSYALDHPITSYRDALLNFNISPMISIMFNKKSNLSLRLDEALISGHDDDLALRLIRIGNFAFDNILATTIIQHQGHRISSQKNLMVGDFQLLEKYADDIFKFHGHKYLLLRFGVGLAGLWSVGECKKSMQFIFNSKFNSLEKAVAIAIAFYYLPSKIALNIRKLLLLSIAHHFL